MNKVEREAEYERTADHPRPKWTYTNDAGEAALIERYGANNE